MGTSSNMKIIHVDCNIHWAQTITRINGHSFFIDCLHRNNNHVLIYNTRNSTEPAAISGEKPPRTGQFYSSSLAVEREASVGVLKNYNVRGDI